jgi:very-short-patch-repair endonuclease
MSPEEKDRRTVVMRKRVMGGQYMTTPEANVCTALNEVDVFYQLHKVIGRYTADFLVLPNLVVEADGEYWHKAEHDATRDAYMADHGYRVLRIPESASQEDIEAMLREALGETASSSLDAFASRVLALAAPDQPAYTIFVTPEEADRIRVKPSPSARTRHTRQAAQ